MKNQIKGKKGITLIALIVTIIVLLILAGVTIATLTGDNGLLQKATNAKEKSVEAEGLEKVRLARMASYDNEGKIDTKKLAENLNKIEGIENVGDDIELPSSVKWNSGKGVFKYKITDEGDVYTKKPGAVEAADIKNNESTYYGKYVTNYNSLSDAGIKYEDGQLGKWQIFLADDTNIYLIASNQISKEYAPFNFTNNGDYYLYFNHTILNRYNTSTHPELSVATILGKLGKEEKYHEWLNVPGNLKNEDNQKAVLAMLDTDKWNEYTDGNTTKGFKNSKYASYVIGGPTLEMFCNSYNSTHGGDDIIPKPKKDGESGNYYVYGYKTKYGENDADIKAEGLKASKQVTDNSDINKMHFNCSYWLASTGARHQADLWFVRNDGLLMEDFHDSIDVKNGFRPVVCLKSNVNLIEKTNGTIKTYELE